MLPLLDQINDLKRLPRTGWLLAGIAPVESIADHAFATALLALLLAQTINADYAAAQLAQPLDLARVLQIALIHDLAESQVTDLPHRATRLLGEPAKHAAEHAAFAALTAALPQAAQWQALFADYRAAASAEARVVRDADKLELAHQALRYAQAGTRNLDEFVAMRNYFFAASSALHNAIAAAFAATRS